MPETYTEVRCCWDGSGRRNQGPDGGTRTRGTRIGQGGVVGSIATNLDSKLVAGGDRTFVVAKAKDEIAVIRCVDATDLKEEIGGCGDVDVSTS